MTEADRKNALSLCLQWQEAARAAAAFAHESVVNDRYLPRVKAAQEQAAIAHRYAALYFATYEATRKENV
jgi:hypothetical protein